jgi:hypothetical protein
VFPAPVERHIMVAHDLVIVWLNNRHTLWRWDDAAEEYFYLRNLTEDERRLIENGNAADVTERELITGK